MDTSTLLADVIAAIHLVYVSVVVLGLPLILLGWPLGWKWIRNPWFRITHLAMMLIVAGEAYADVTCPLTTWELRLRRQADPRYGELEATQLRDMSFMGRLVRHTMFYDKDPGDILLYGYYAFAGTLLAAAIVIPPRFRRANHAPTQLSDGIPMRTA